MTSFEYIVFNVISFFETARDAPTEEEHCYGRVSDIAEAGILVPLPLYLVQDSNNLVFFHVVCTASFVAFLEYVNLYCACKIDWHGMLSWFQPPISSYIWRWTTVSDWISVERGVKQPEDGMKYGMLPRKGMKVTWHGVIYETVEATALSAPENVL